MKALTRLYRALVLTLACLPWAASAADLRRAVAYLEVEVPKWKPANNCYSCHNDGDGLRALISAHRAGVKLEQPALDSALGALRDPAAWEAKPLARLQFAAAARDAVEAGLARHETLEAAARALAADQLPDGHWQVEEELAVGSPVTYGPVLAAWLARSVLESAGAKRHATSIERATRWLERQPRRPGHVLDLAAIVLALNRPSDRARLAAAQLPNGSWNNEPFDTAIALLGLGSVPPKARAWLASRQLPGGGWPGTTRPAGGESYAQHISTTAWVVIALTAPARP